MAPNIYSLILTRLFQGTAACIEGPVAAGVVADLFPKTVRGPAMGTFVLTVFTGGSLVSKGEFAARMADLGFVPRALANATGPLCAGWIAQKLGWHWVYWLVCLSNNPLFCPA